MNYTKNLNHHDLHLNLVDNRSRCIVENWIFNKLYEIMGYEHKDLIQYVIEKIHDPKTLSSEGFKNAISDFLNPENATIFANELIDMIAAVNSSKNAPSKPSLIGPIQKKVNQNIDDSNMITIEYLMTEFEGYRLPRINEKNPYKNHCIPSTPSPREHEEWKNQHKNFKSRTRNFRSDELLFVGDSIIKGLQRFSSIWNEFFFSKKMHVFGIAGDRTQNVLYRLIDAELSSRISLVIIHCGDNNLDRNHPKDIVCGLKAIVFEVQKINSKCSILVVGLIPRGKNWLSRRGKIKIINEELKKAFDQKNIFNVWYLNAYSGWQKPDGKLDPLFYHSDMYHLSERGYRKLCLSLFHKIDTIMSERHSDSYKKLLQSELMRIQEETSISESDMDSKSETECSYSPSWAKSRSLTTNSTENSSYSENAYTQTDSRDSSRSKSSSFTCSYSDKSLEPSLASPTKRLSAQKNSDSSSSSDDDDDSVETFNVNMNEEFKALNSINCKKKSIENSNDSKSLIKQNSRYSIRNPISKLKLNDSTGYNYSKNNYRHLKDLDFEVNKRKHFFKTETFKKINSFLRRINMIEQNVLELNRNLLSLKSDLLQFHLNGIENFQDLRVLSQLVGDYPLLTDHHQSFSKNDCIMAAEDDLDVNHITNKKRRRTRKLGLETDQDFHQSSSSRRFSNCSDAE